MFKNTFLKSLHSYSVIFTTCMLLSTWSLFGASGDSTKIWVGTWYTAPQLVETNNMPPSPGLTNNSLRQVVRVSIGGDTIRVKFSNHFSEDTVIMKAAKIAVADSGSAIYDTTTVKLTFAGNPEVIMEPGAAVISDPIAYNLKPRTDIAITIYYGKTSETATGHPGSRTTSYLIAGNDTSVTDFTDAVTTDHWYNILGIDVLAPPTSTCVAVLGNSITDGRGSTTNMQNRWTDYLSEKFLTNPGTEQVGVLNLGLGGNCVLKFCLGPPALDRFERDVLDQPGVRSAIIFEGVNDIGGVKNAEVATTVANDLIAAYKTMIDSAHARNIWIYGATITPFKGNGYYNTSSEACRTKINNWIRNSDRFDAVIDFDKAVLNPDDSLRLLSSYQNDYLHPDTTLYPLMIDAIDLNLFEGLDTLNPVMDTSGIEAIWIEPECAMVGEKWKTILDPKVSNQSYVTADTSSISEAPADSVNAIYIPFTVADDTTYYLYARLNCPSTDDDSYWIKMDDEDFVNYDGLSTSGWEWKEINNYSLTTGEHTLTIAYGEDGTNLDKLYITNDTVAPTGLGKPADIVCLPDTTTPVVVVGLGELTGGSDTYTLEQNYPNPFTDITSIAFEIPNATYVSLKVYSVLGKEIAELAGKEYTSGKHTVEFNATGLSKGLYFYTIKTDTYSSSRKMIIQAE